MAHLQLHDIDKHFPGVKALTGVSLEILPGEIHALCGENGAGKSTLMNVLTGNLQPDGGTIVLNGQPVVIRDQQHAFDLGIAIVHQHLSLVESLSVAENIFANAQPANRWGIIRYNKLREQSLALLEDLHLDDIDPWTRLSDLSAAQKQMVEIAKALSRNPSLLILDEPTASLTDKETGTLFAILSKLKDRGVAIVYISHRLNEIFQLADRISVLKDGKYQGTFPKDALTKEQLIAVMVGREIKALKSESFVRPEVLMSVKDLSGKGFHGISLDIHAGEILGLSGLVGAGRTEIARAIFGVDPPLSGQVLLRNQSLGIKHPVDAIANGIAYVPEDRKQLGLFGEMSIQDNIVSARLENALNGRFYSAARAKALALDAKGKLGIATPDVDKKVMYLSGGNQQKVVLAKWLLIDADVLIVDEPTHGIDVGAKFEIYEILKGLAKEGKAILMISSELPELLGLCDRILVIREGTMAGSLLRSEATEEAIMHLATN